MIPITAADAARFAARALTALEANAEARAARPVRSRFHVSAVDLEETQHAIRCVADSCRALAAQFIDENTTGIPVPPPAKPHAIYACTTPARMAALEALHTRVSEILKWNQVRTTGAVFDELVNLCAAVEEAR